MEIKDEFNWQKQHFILFKQGFLLLLLSLQTFGTVTAQPITGDVKPCLTKTCPNGGIVCVCNATYCDLLPSSVVEGMVGHDGAAVIYSSMSGARWQTSRQPFGQQTTSNQTIDGSFKTKQATIEIDPSERFQEIFGFGGSFTDSMGMNVQALSAETKKRFFDSYYGQTGTDYTTGRVPMASTDFSTHVYSYAEMENDFDLEHFALAKEDIEMKIPMIKEAFARAGGKSKLRLFSSPWSAPGWMKRSGTMYGGGMLKGDLTNSDSDLRFYKSFANYYIRFFEEYSKQGVEFWGMTVANEPNEGANDNYYAFQAMDFNPIILREFVKKFLGPTIRGNPLTAGLKLMMNDDNRNYLPNHADIILGDKEAAKYINGIGIHWYSWWIGPECLDLTHKTYPDYFILATEACNAWGTGFPERWEGKNGPSMGNWTYGEYYAQNIIEDLEHWVVGWVDWNMALNQTGGPSWVGHVATDAPIIVNAESDEFYKQPMYYVLGHFSKFIRPGSYRIKTRVFTDDGSDLGCRAVGTVKSLCATSTFDSSTGQITLVVMNRDPEYGYRVQIGLKQNRLNDPAQQLVLDMEPNSIATVLISTKSTQAKLR